VTHERESRRSERPVNTSLLSFVGKREVIFDFSFIIKGLSRSEKRPLLSRKARSERSERRFNKGLAKRASPALPASLHQRSLASPLVMREAGFARPKVAFLTRASPSVTRERKATQSEPHFRLRMGKRGLLFILFWRPNYVIRDRRSRLYRLYKSEL
jgi:hypothetical protein